MAPTSLVLSALLVLAAAAAHAPRGAEAATGTPSNVLISGIVRCNDRSSTDLSAVPDATVQLVCGGNVVTSVSADDNGTFVIDLKTSVLSSSLELLTSLVTGKCKVVATTPLAACSVSLPGATGTTTLAAPLQLLGATTGLVTFIGGVAVTTVGGILSFVAGVFSVV
ncbi:unnamed protein product [Urochloa decumbens]|uniref:Uncharacterized protein n=1 Tax=Urochloa decumbens TaxID=240449 RepID=A0ABC8Y8F5_9POAL